MVDLPSLEIDVVNMKVVTLLKTSGPSVLLASLCCLTPVALVLFGASITSFGVVLFTKTLSRYEWIFGVLRLASLGGSLTIYFRRTGICTLDQVKARRNEILNVTLLALITGAIAYEVWYFGIVAYAGTLLHLWS